jgi:two-component system chemotaxis sensor kinase CheA
MTIDMSKYLGLFCSEATEHLEALGQDLVAVEKSPGGAAIDSMFRHAHSVKGMASSMGFEAIATLAHRVEDLVDGVRSDRSLLTREVVDLLLNATDTMLSQVKAAGDGRQPDDARALLDQLSARVAAITGQQPAPTRVARAIVNMPAAQADAAPAPASPAAATAAAAAAVAAAAAAPATAAALAQAAGQKSEGSLGLPPRFVVKVRIAASCQVPGVRAFLVHKKLSALGNIFDLRPPLEDLKAGRVPEGMISLELETSHGEAGIGHALKNVSEVELVSLKPVAPPPPVPVAAAAAAAATAAPAPEAPKVVGVPEGRTVRVRTELLDYFLDSVGELLLATARIREVGKVLPEVSRPPLEEAVYRLHTLVKDLHDKVMTVRMTPLSVITDRLPRAARDIARKREREVDLIITGAEIELDRAIIDDLADPLLHILRNCIDHGLESPADRAAAGKAVQGRVVVSVRRARDRVVVEIEDDGRGMDAGKLKAAALARGLITAETASRMTDREAFMLSCLPGVSTARDVSEISGRGVGMDAVKKTVENVGGTLEIDSEKGRGTRFTLRLPLTVAVVNLLLVQVGEEIFGLPIGKVQGALEADADKLGLSRGTAMLPSGGTLLPVHSLSDLLALSVPPKPGVRPYVVMEAESGKVALAVDKLLGQEEVVLKALSRPLDLVPGLSGVTILGSGRPVFILDVPRLLN